MVLKSSKPLSMYHQKYEYETLEKLFRKFQLHGSMGATKRAVDVEF